MSRLFDLSTEYEAMLSQGIRLSGENMFFFIEGRLAAVRTWVGESQEIRDILDFGCGLGHTTARLASLFPGASIAGADTSSRALEWARGRNGGPRIRFLSVGSLEAEESRYDLIYVNGVFHHIPLADRSEAMGLLARLLAPGGRLVLFENNPLNPGARIVMARIPFDKDAHMVWPGAASQLCRVHGLKVRGIRTLFYFPRALRALRFLEPYLERVRLGAQYAVLADSPAPRGS